MRCTETPSASAIFSGPIASMISAGVFIVYLYRRFEECECRTRQFPPGFPFQRVKPVGGQTRAGPTQLIHAALFDAKQRHDPIRPDVGDNVLSVFHAYSYPPAKIIASGLRFFLA